MIEIDVKTTWMSDTPDAEKRKAAKIVEDFTQKLSEAGASVVCAEGLRSNMLEMQTRFVFQYKPKHGRPDEMTLAPTMHEVHSDMLVPSIGDIVTLQLASNAREFQTEQVGILKSFIVAGRHFMMVTDGMQPHEPLVNCDIVIIVTDVDDDVIGVDFKA